MAKVLRKYNTFFTGRTDQEDTLLDDMKEITHIESKQYLGQILSSYSNYNYNFEVSEVLYGAA